MDEPPVSVVTPVYNTEEHLDTCIQSVRAQTYTNWEYVVFDNRSTDRSAEIAEEHAAEDDRIRVVHSDEHRPQLENYNRALREVSPEASFVTLAQADDWLFPRCLERLVRAAHRGDSRVGLVCCYRVMGEEIIGAGLPFEGSPDQEPHTVVSGDAPCRLWLLEGRNIIGSPTATLYRREIVDRLEPFFLPDSYPLADAEVAFRCLHEFDFGFVHQIMGFIRPADDDSISTRVWRKYTPGRLNRVLLLENYGKRYLTDEELARSRSEAWSRYRADLVKSVVLWGGDREFWRYHQQRLASIGHEISWKTFVKGFWVLLREPVRRAFRKARALQAKIRG